MMPCASMATGCACTPLGCARLSAEQAGGEDGGLLSQVEACHGPLHVSKAEPACKSSKQNRPASQVNQTSANQDK